MLITVRLCALVSVLKYRSALQRASLIGTPPSFVFVHPHSKSLTMIPPVLAIVAKYFTFSSHTVLTRLD